MKRTTSLIIMGFLSICVMQTTANGAYTITDLGTFGGDYARPLAINDNGHIVGYIGYNSNPLDIPALYYDGTTTHDLGTLGGTRSIASDINNNNQIAGASSIEGNVFSHAFLFGGTMHDLGTLGSSSEVTGINNNGQIVGVFHTGGRRHAFLYDGTMHDLGISGLDYTSARAINDSGQIAVTSGSDSLNTHAFMYDGTFHDLGTLGGTIANALDINENGHIVGTSFLAGDTISRAFLHDGITMHDLGTLGGTNSRAHAINDNGQILMWDNNGLILYDNGTLMYLESLLPAGSGWEITEANGINNSGQIVGIGKINGQSSVFLMTPIPEPGTIALLGLGGLAILRKQK